MRPLTIIIAGIAVGTALALAGCGHKLVTTSGEKTVSIYPDEDTYKKIEQMKGAGGVAGMFGGLGESLATKRVANDTPVKILSSDDTGSEVEILNGSEQGQKGFVPKENVD
jgi:hypothetical protein